MEEVKTRNFQDIVLGFFLLMHPGPVLLHIIAVTIFALIAAWPHFIWGIILLVIAAHAAMQVSIAFINDYCDRERDAVSKPSKPIVRGLVHPREALFAGVVLILVMLLLLIPLNPLALLISLLYLALGQGYNFGLKSTPFSGFVFALMIPLIPLYAFAGVGYVAPFVIWLIPVAALLGVVVNLANSLPDIEEDAETNARTLAVVLGVRSSYIVCSVLILLSALLIAIFTVVRLVPANMLIIVPTLLFTCLAPVLAFWYFGPQKPARMRKAYFYSIVLICMILAGGWLIGVFV